MKQLQTITDKNWWGRIDTFEPVSEFPTGYRVWAIGRPNFKHERCVPLCKGPINCIDLKSLKYIMVASEELALRVLKEAIQHECNQKRFQEIVYSNS